MNKKDQQERSPENLLRNDPFLAIVKQENARRRKLESEVCCIEENHVVCPRCGTYANLRGKVAGNHCCSTCHVLFTLEIVVKAFFVTKETRETA